MNYGVVNKPKSGITLRVWEVADEITQVKGRRARRKEVVDRITAEGGNPNTASTQYYYWRTAQEGNLGLVDADPEADSGSGSALRLAVARDGTMQLPPVILKALKVAGGGTLAARFQDGELRLMEPRTALKRARALVREFDTGEGSPVDELIAERRRESAE